MASTEPQIDTSPPSGVSAPDAEAARLRGRIAALEAELAEVHARANAAIAAAEERAYWLDRWHLDLNELMRRPGAARARTLVRSVRSVFRLGRKARRALKR